VAAEEDVDEEVEQLAVEVGPPAPGQFGRLLHVGDVLG
jgi:hypothetical protein